MPSHENYDWSEHSEHLVQVIVDSTAVFRKLVFQFRHPAAAHCEYAQREFLLRYRLLGY